jgi:hypothetical protein
MSGSDLWTSLVFPAGSVDLGDTNSSLSHTKLRSLFHAFTGLLSTVPAHMWSLRAQIGSPHVCGNACFHISQQFRQCDNGARGMAGFYIALEKDFSNFPSSFTGLLSTVPADMWSLRTQIGSPHVCGNACFHISQQFRQCDNGARGIAGFCIALEKDFSNFPSSFSGLYVCTFGKEGAGKGTVWDHTGKKKRPETTEVSDATVRMEAVHCRFQNTDVPLFGPYRRKSGSSNNQFGTQTCRHSQFGSTILPSFGEEEAHM